MDEYADLLPSMPRDQWRRVRGEQDIIVRYEPERALETLPELLRDPADRRRLVTLAQRLLADERMQRARPTREQLAMIETIGKTLAVGAAPAKRSSRRTAHKPPPKAARAAARS
jgi:hypothetical protein